MANRAILLTGATTSLKRSRRRGAAPVWPADHLCSGCFSHHDGFMIQSGDTFFCLTCTLKGKLVTIDQINQNPPVFPIRFPPNYFSADHGRKKQAHQLAQNASTGGLDKRRALQLLKTRSLPGSVLVPIDDDIKRSSLLLECECFNCRIYPIPGMAFTKQTGDGVQSTCLRCFLTLIDMAKQSNQTNYVNVTRWSVTYAWLPHSTGQFRQNAKPTHAVEKEMPADDKVFCGLYMRALLSVANVLFERLWQENVPEHLGLKQKILSTNAFGRSMLDLAMASFDFGHNVQSLKSGYVTLSKLEQDKYFDQHPCLVHLWREPRPPCRELIPLRPPSPATRRLAPCVTLSHPTKPTESSSARLWNTAVVTDDEGDALWPDVVLAGVWPTGKVGDLDCTDPRMSKPIAEECLDNSQKEQTDQKEQKMGDQKDRRECGCGVPRCWVESSAVRNLVLGKDIVGQNVLVPRNWMPQTVCLLTRAWTVLVNAAPEKWRPLLANLRILLVVMEPEETQKFMFWDSDQLLFPNVDHHDPQKQQEMTFRGKSIDMALCTDVKECTTQPLTTVLPPTNDWMHRYRDLVHTSPTNGVESLEHGSTHVLLARDRARSIAKQFQPFPYGMYSLHGSMLIDAVDATQELNTLKPDLLMNPIIQFVCQWIQTILRTRLANHIPTEQIIAFLQHTVKNNQQHLDQHVDERLKLVFHLIHLHMQKNSPPPAPINAPINAQDDTKDRPNDEEKQTKSAVIKESIKESTVFAPVNEKTETVKETIATSNLVASGNEIKEKESGLTAAVIKEKESGLTAAVRLPTSGDDVVVDDLPEGLEWDGKLNADAVEILRQLLIEENKGNNDTTEPANTDAKSEAKFDPPPTYAEQETTFTMETKSVETTMVVTESKYDDTDKAVKIHKDIVVGSIDSALKNTTLKHSCPESKRSDVAQDADQTVGFINSALANADSKSADMVQDADQTAIVDMFGANDNDDKTPRHVLDLVDTLVKRIPKMNNVGVIVAGKTILDELVPANRKGSSVECTVERPDGDADVFWGETIYIGGVFIFVSILLLVSCCK